MGSNARYELSWEPNRPNGYPVEARNATIVPDPAGISDITAGMAQLAGGGEPDGEHLAEIMAEWEEILEGDIEADWPEREVHMGGVSRKWPDTLFRLAVEEGHGGHRMEYYLRGRMQTVDGEILFPLPGGDRWREAGRDPESPPSARKTD